eukprot:TRINITY_DN57475_c0_g1_i1.p1 TRINITY_DN57475_c0_g1~~TRINITY_DN57475_c0_g1_i1.p1  ORF type:complete len:856 (-),score=121.70 TRINITY_DN57475_c0_g1_i1:501-2906(-)
MDGWRPRPATSVTYQQRVGSQACDEHACKWQLSLAQLQRVHTQALRPSIVAFTGSVKTLGKATAWSFAERLLHQQQLVTVEPDVVYTNNAVGAATDWQKALSVLPSTRAFGGEIDTVTYNSLIGALRGQPLWILSLSLMHQLRDSILMPSAVTCSSTVRACERGMQWRWTLALIDETDAEGLATTISYNIAISSCGKSGQAQAASLCFRALAQSGLQASRVSYNAVMTALEKAPSGVVRYNSAVQQSAASWLVVGRLFDSMRAAAVQCDAITLRTAAVSALQAGHWRRSLRYITSSRCDDSLAQRSLICRTSSQSTQWQEGMHAFDDLVSCHDQVDIQLAQLVARSSSKTASWAQAVQLLQSLPARRVQQQLAFDVAVYGRDASLEHWSHALQALGQTRSMHLEVSLACMSSTIQLVSSSVWGLGETLLASIQTNTLEPNLVCYSAMAHASSRTTMWLSAIQQTEKLAFQKLKTDAVWNTDVVKILADAGTQGAWRLAIEALAGHTCSMEADILGGFAMLGGLERSSCWQRAAAQMEEQRWHGLAVDTEVINVVHSSCQKATAWATSMRVMQMIGSAKLQPDTMSFDVGISGSSKGGQWELAVRMFCALVAFDDSGIQVDVIGLAGVVDALEGNKEWQRAVLLVERHAEQLAASLDDELCCTSLMRCCETSGQWERALPLYSRSKVSSTATCNTALSACCSGGQWRLLMYLMMTALEQRVFIDDIGFTTALSACREFHLWERAASLLELMTTLQLEPLPSASAAAAEACGEGPEGVDGVLRLLTDIDAKASDIIGFSEGVS